MNNAPQRPPSTIIRCISALCAATFLFFLIYTAPHRVHHFFEQTRPQSHAHNHDDGSNRHDTPSTGPDCVFQASASRCAIGLTTQIQPLVLTLFVQNSVIFPDSTSHEQFLPGSFQIRAPPKA